MVNWQDPVNIELEYFGDLKVIYFVLGMFIWEISSTLYFDWEVITGKRVFRWPYLLYVGCRICTPFYLTSAAVGFNIMTRFNCQAWILVIYISGYLGVGLGSALLTLRTIAFWNSNRIVVGLAISLCLLHLSFLIYAMTQARSIWDAETNACIELDTEHNLKNFLVTLSTDLALLTIMLSGIWKRRKAGGLWTLMYRQGILWVAGATFGQLPCVILTSLDYNDAMNLLLQPFATLAMAFCASRMYRELCEYANPAINDQYLSIDVSPLKAKKWFPPPSTPMLGADFLAVSEEFGRRPPNNIILDLSSEYSRRPGDV